MAEAERRNLFGTISAWPLSKKLSLFAVALLSLSIFALIILQARHADYQVLYANLSQSEGSSVIRWLQEHNIPYKIKGGGGSIYVPANQVYETRLKLAGQGLPKGGGVGFEIFDQQDFGITKFTQKVNYQRALQGELARTVSALEPVKSARVHLVLPEKRLLQEQQKPAKASVVLDLKKGNSLNSVQTEGIVHLVSGSIEGLEKQNVTVVDSAGRVLSEGSGQSMDEGLTPERLEYKQTLETRLENQAQSLLDQALGQGKSLVRVTADLDFSQKEVTEEIYDPDSIVPRSEKTTERSSGVQQAGGVPGAEGNLGSNSTRSLGQPSSESSEVINYEISKTINQVEKPVGSLENLSVAVLVADKFNAGAGQNKGDYVPRSEEELNSIEKMVSSALGLKKDRGDRIEVVSMPFKHTAPATVSTGGTGSEFGSLYEYIPYVKYGLLLLAALLLYFLLIRPLIRTMQGDTVHHHKTVRELEQDTETKALDPASQLRREIDTSNTSPVQVVKTWLKEG